MSFGYYDKDWVDPPDETPVKCGNCDEWVECPCDCGLGYCKVHDYYSGADDEC